MAVTTVPAGACERFARAWLTRTFRTYPEQTGGFLDGEPDPFRNPIGHTLRTALGDLSVELFGGFDRGRVATALEAVIRLRAVQEFSPEDAVGFVALAREAAREAAAAEASGLGPDAPGVIDARIDEMGRLAADLFERCREQIREISVRAARRRTFVLERMHARAAGAGERSPADLRGEP